MLNLSGRPKLFAKVTIYDIVEIKLTQCQVEAVKLYKL